jgi:hypothetical protein
MGFLPNIKQMAEDAIEKEYETIEKIPAVQAAQKDLSKGLTELAELEAKITPQEVVFALNVLFPGKFTLTEITNGEASLNKVIAAAKTLKANLTKELTGK